MLADMRAMDGIKIQLYQGNCLEVMKKLETGSVDAVITDPPYNMTRLDYDKSILDWSLLWNEINRVGKENSINALFSAQPFTTDLIMSNRKKFRYEIIWCKTMGTRFLDANKMPLRAHETILIFTLPCHGKGNLKTSTYNPQFTSGLPYKRFHRHDGRGNRASHYNSSTDPFKPTINEDGKRYPFDWIIFSNNNNGNKHPSQKPLGLMKWLILTYSNPGDTVLDFCMGSGTTGVAAVQLERRFIGIEIDPAYFEIAKKRIEQAQLQIPMPLEIMDKRTFIPIPLPMIIEEAE